MRNEMIDLIDDAMHDWYDWVSEYNENGEVPPDSFVEHIADHLIANGVTIQKWIPANKPPKKYRDEYGELIPFLVCEYGTEEPFRAFYDGRAWGDSYFEITVTHWMPLPKGPKEEA